MEHSAADDPLEAPRRRPGSARRTRGTPPPSKGPAGDLVKKRLIAFAVGVAILVLLLFGLRACLDARKARSYEDYLRDLDALATNTSQLSSEFFQRFRDPGEASKLEFQAQLGASRGTSEELLSRAQGLDAPDELDQAQKDLELAFELRRDGVASVVEQTETALGNRGSLAAVEQISLDMRKFLASDVLYSRAREEIERVLAEQELNGEVPPSQFLPEPIEPWLDELELAAMLARVAGETGGADTSRGTELSSTVLRPGNVPLAPDSLNSVAKLPDGVEVAVVNGGVSDERDVVVSYEILGSTDLVEGEMTIARIAPGESGSTVIPVDGDIPTGEELSLIVTVLPVPGETIIENNKLAYRVTFE